MGFNSFIYSIFSQWWKQLLNLLSLQSFQSFFKLLNSKVEFFDNFPLISFSPIHTSKDRKQHHKTNMKNYCLVQPERLRMILILFSNRKRSFGVRDLEPPGCRMGIKILASSIKKHLKEDKGTILRKLQMMLE